MNNPSFTRGEYWLLEAAVEAAFPVCWLDWSELEEAINKPGHGMSRTLLIESMQNLIVKGFVEVFHTDHWGDPLRLSTSDIDNFLNEDRNNKCYFYRLTAKGGASWEMFACPNWDFYIYNEFAPLSENDILVGSLVCSNESYLEQCFCSMSKHDFEVDENSIKWDFIEPWQATYWKQLPRGFRVSFRCQEKLEIGKDPLSKQYVGLSNKMWYRWA